MSRVFCIANQKGGVGKTTTAINLAAALATSGGRTLLVDLDPQCNATTGLGHKPIVDHPLATGGSITNAVVSTSVAGLDLLPGSRAYRDVARLAQGDAVASVTLERQMAAGLAAYDYALFDCPPSLGRLTEIALAISDEVVMPIQCEYFAMEGLAEMIQVIGRVIRQSRRLKFGGILLTMYDPALELTREVDTEVREFFGDIVFRTVIPRDVAVSEAPSHGRSVLDHAPRSRGARAYVELCMEVLEV
jgi:chromosome partitioning protein